MFVMLQEVRLDLTRLKASPGLQTKFEKVGTIIALVLSAGPVIFGGRWGMTNTMQWFCTALVILITGVWLDALSIRTLVERVLQQVHRLSSKD